MNKLSALICTLFFTALIFGASTFVSNQSHTTRESAIVARVIDGDTLTLDDGTTIRLLNINAPEKGTSGSTLAKNVLAAFKDSHIEVDRTGTDKYHRVLARLYGPEYINLELVQEGLASKFLVQEDELKTFADAEANAITHERGIWKHASEFGCITAAIDAIQERALLKNTCSPFSINNWTLKDESRKTYHFGNRQLSTLTLHSESGVDTTSDIYWNSQTSVWNNDRDSLYLFNDKGELAAWMTYGYE